MSVLMKGTDVQNCKECPCCVDYGDPYCSHEYVCNALYLKNVELCDIPEDRDGRLNNCPLVEIPSPHGRLIDADKFLDWLQEFHPNDVTIMSGVKNARTIIEAEV